MYSTVTLRTLIYSPCFSCLYIALAPGQLFQIWFYFEFQTKCTCNFSNAVSFACFLLSFLLIHYVPYEMTSATWTLSFIFNQNCFCTYHISTLFAEDVFTVVTEGKISKWRNAYADQQDNGQQGCTFGKSFLHPSANALLGWDKANTIM